MALQEELFSILRAHLVLGIGEQVLRARLVAAHLRVLLPAGESRGGRRAGVAFADQVCGSFTI